MVIELSEVQFGLYVRDRNSAQRDYNACIYSYVTCIFFTESQILTIKTIRLHMDNI